METVIRVAIVYLFVLVFLRVLGKREFSQLTPFNLVTLLLIPELAQQAMIREDFSMTNAIIALSTLLTLVMATSLLNQLSAGAERAVEGSPTVIVRDGELLADAMNRERISPSEVYGELHKAGMADLSHVRWAILETDGKISFIPRGSKNHPGEEPRGENAPG